MKNRTKILATIGPASRDVDTLSRMIKAGTNLFRLNFSHGDHAYHSESLSNIRQAAKETGITIGVLQDISGPKIRVGVLQEPFELKNGDTLILQKDEMTGIREDTGKYRCNINHHWILDKLNIGGHVYLSDGMIQTHVDAIAENEVHLRIDHGGMLSSKKGVNFPNTPIGIDILTAKDIEDMGWGVQNGVDFMAISFVQCADDMINARKVLDDMGGDADLIAKIEKFDAVENIDAILEASDGIMVARGDLGIEMPYYKIPSIQKALIHKANTKAKPVITATQMMLSMTNNTTATRAEISDVANAVLDGSDAVMLSEETAIGIDPVNVIETMSRTISETEQIYNYNLFQHYEYEDDTDVIHESSVMLAHNLKCDAIVAISGSGLSVKKLARYRPSSPILAVLANEKVARKLTLVWGVSRPIIINRGTTEQMLKDIVLKYMENHVFDFTRSYIVTSSEPSKGIPGSTNQIRILKSNELKHFFEK
jgi:pyruvate kinase